MPTIRINITQQQLQSLHAGGDIIISLGGDAQPAAAPDTDLSFFTLISQQTDRLRQAGSLRTAETYRAALCQLRRFWQAASDDDLPLAAVTPELMEQYQRFLRSRDLTMNTVSFYMRKLKAVYYRAVQKGLTVDRQPFSRVYTGIAKTAKRSLTLSQLKALKQLNLSDHRLLFARDMFLFSFYTRGMAFVDMAYLQKKDICNGVLTYRRHKTGQQLCISWERYMQDIINRHPATATGYLLPIIRRNNGKERNQYRHLQSEINRHLKTVARMAGIDEKLTMYCARHSWATIARDIQVPMNVISCAMGHTTERTTEIYLRSVNISNVDKANRRIIAML